FVLGLPEAGLGERLEGAIERARQLLAHGGAGSSIIPEALVEVFALEDEEDDELEPMLEPGTLVGGRYRVAQQIGSGGFADVYRAEDQEVEGHVVALKVLHRKALTDAARAQALRELHLIASVFHPSIVQFKDHGWFDDRFWFVMPWYQGESLESRIERGPLDRLEAKRIFVPLARALAAMHSAGMRHQDVKPDNIFLTRLEGFGGEGGDDVLPVLLDLGVAAKEAELLLAGTPDYFAPEVAAQFARVPSSAAIGAPADVFSLALSLRNALEPETSEILEEEAIDAFIEARAMRPPEPPRGRALRFLRPSFRRWMSPDPSERPSAERFAEELSILTLPEERRQRRIRVLIVALPLLLAATAIFLGVAWRLDQRAREEERRAELARDEAAGARASLEEAEERRRELETKVAQTEERYLSSRLTRDQLAGRLAQEEAGLAFAREDLERSRRRILALGESLRESQEQAEELERRLSSERRAKQVVEARVLELDAELARVRAELEAARVSLAAASAEAERGAAQLEEARASLAAATRQVEEASAGARASEAQASEAESRLQAAEARVEAAEARARSADERIAAAEGEARQAEERARQAEAERARAESELERARRRIAELEREPQAEVPRVPPGPELSPSGMRPRPRRP
ncbi:MAG: protein kinase, partial [Myxococcales bacterium]|nr:protein kinase [Myxococcales bacterium]